MAFCAIVYLIVVFFQGIIVDQVNSVNIDLEGSGDTKRAAVGQTVTFKCTITEWDDSEESDKVLWIRHLDIYEHAESLFEITEDGYEQGIEIERASLSVSDNTYTLVLEDVQEVDSGIYGLYIDDWDLTDYITLLVTTNTTETTDVSAISTETIAETKTSPALLPTSLPSISPTTTVITPPEPPLVSTLPPTTSKDTSTPIPTSKGLPQTTENLINTTMPQTKNISTLAPTMPQTNISSTLSQNALSSTSNKCSKSCVNGICGYDSIGDTETCVCNEGFQQLDQDTCQDIDECDSSHECSGSSEQCVNQVGGYSCQCLPGYSYKQDGTCTASLTYLGKLSLESIENQNVYWNDSLEDHISSYYIWLASTIQFLMDQILMGDERSNLNYLGTQLKSFHQGSIIAEFTSRFEDLEEYSSDVMMDSDSFSVILHDYINGSSMSFGNFSIGIDPNSVVFTDFDECSDPVTNDCSSNADCINIDGSFQCQCQDGFLDESDGELKDPGRVCTMQFDYEIMFIILGVVGSVLVVSVCLIIACYCYVKGRSSRDFVSRQNSRTSDRQGLDTRSSLVRMDMMTENENAMTLDYDGGAGESMTEFYSQPDLILPANYPLSLQKYAISNGTIEPSYDYHQYPSAANGVITTILPNSLQVGGQRARSAPYWSHPEEEGTAASQMSGGGDPHIIPRVRPAYFPAHPDWSTAANGTISQISVMDYF